MVDPANHTLQLLREMRRDNEGMRTEMRQGFQELSQSFRDLLKRMDNQQKALTGESILARYATAEYDERIEKLEQRVSALESTDNPST